MHRRDVLSLLSLSALAVAGGPLLTGCADREPGRSAGADVTAVQADVERSPGDRGAVAQVVDALHRSGGALFGRLAGGHGNLTLSPYSIAIALAMTANGAAGETRRQLEQAIGGLDIERANGGLNALGGDLHSLTGVRTGADGKETEVVLNAANALFGQRGVAWERPFLATLAEHYGAGVNTVDYARAAEAARGAVNSWTSKRTRERIPEILPPGSVNELTRLVLVNALHLKAQWDAPFEKGLTDEVDFHLPDSTTVAVPMMHSHKPLALDAASGPGWQAVQLPYAGRELAMTIVLPDAGQYGDVEADVVAGRLGDYLEVPERDAPLMVDVTLPRWTFRTGGSLKTALEELDVELPFTEDADLTLMTEDDLDLHVGEVFHEVFIAVDENGTEAAAATAVVIMVESAPSVDLTFVVDRPFLFVIHDVAHGTPLFLGRVLDPRA